ncbi:MAG: radical SAM protein [Acetanaerobacterium sp.]
MGQNPVVARAGVHRWEEPCISGTNGSGTVFFSGCALRCVYCQNHEISHGGKGREITPLRLREIYHELIAQGVHNINLVNPTHFTDAVAQSLASELNVPVVYNSGGYELVSSLRALEGKIQIYLPDLKYADSAAAARYSGAPDYFEYATAAIREMHRQTGDYVLDENGMLLRGVLIRHLVLPANIKNTLAVIDWVRGAFPNGGVLFSLMGQYTPCGDLSATPEINRRVTKREYEKAQDHLFASGIEDGFVQALSSAGQDYIPAFDFSGV